MFRFPAPAIAAILLLSGSACQRAEAAVFQFNEDPFAGTTALNTPGRQIIGGERFLPVFDIANDQLAFHPARFGTVGGFQFFNGLAGDIPPSGINLVVLRSFDFDGDPNNGNQLNAGQAATLVANAITESQHGFFVYFNSGLDLPRLVFSTDLGSADADLKIIARFTGLNGAVGRAAMADFSAANFGNVPEPESWALLIAGFGLTGAIARRRRAETLAA
jgi:PEP-CTERM motif